MTKEGFTKIVNSISPEAGALVLGRGNIVKIQYFLSPSCLMDQTNLVCTYIYYDQGRVNRNCNIYDPLGRGCFATSWGGGGSKFVYNCYEVYQYSTP